MLDEPQTHSSLKNNQTFNMTRSAQLVVLFVLLATLAYSCEARVCYGGPNDVWTNCGSHCPRTCANPEPGPCILRCKPDTCECREGYYRRADGQCVLFRDCGRRYSILKDNDRSYMPTLLQPLTLLVTTLQLILIEQIIHFNKDVRHTYWNDNFIFPRFN